MFGKYENILYDETQKEFHLASILTDLGERNLYDAVSQCNRCGYCETVCPTYAMTGMETHSARGRNQILRMLIEGKIKNVQNSRESLQTCLLCSACTTACYAKVPTPDIVLEGRRSLTGHGNNIFASFGIKLLLEKPEIFETWLKFAYIFKKLGFSYLASKIGLYHLIGMPAIAQADKSVIKTPLKFLNEILKKNNSLKTTSSPTCLKTTGILTEAGGGANENIKWVYFAPCGPNYLFPEVGLSTINILKRFLGNGIFMNGSCCGLLSYNYGNLKDAKRFAQKNIMKFEEIIQGLSTHWSGNLAENCPLIVGDCSSCVAFMKSYEQLFTDDEDFRERAKKFAKSVRDILEILPEEKINKTSGEKLKKLKISKVTYHDSCRACHGQSITQKPRKILNKLLGENFIELPESDWCCGGAGTFAFTQKNLSSEILKRKIRNIASIQADTVTASATSCLIQIENGLKQHYPYAKIMHYSVLIDKLTTENRK